MSGDIQISPHVGELFVKYGVRRQYRSGEVLLEKGALSAQAGFLVKGQLRTFCLGPSGDEISLFYLGPGNLFGSSALVYHAKVMVSVSGTGRDAADFLLERNDALIIESFGVGGLPEAGGFYDCVRRWMEAGRVVVLTTQVENEGSDLGVYHVGYRLKSDLGVLEAYDMTTEAVVAKLMWILGQTRRREEVERLFYTPVARDILWPGL